MFGSVLPVFPCILAEKDGVEGQVVVGGGSDEVDVDVMRSSVCAVSLSANCEDPVVAADLVPTPCGRLSWPEDRFPVATSLRRSSGVALCIIYETGQPPAPIFLGYGAADLPAAVRTVYQFASPCRKSPSAPARSPFFSQTSCAASSLYSRI